MQYIKISNIVCNLCFPFLKLNWIRYVRWVSPEFCVTFPILSTGRLPTFSGRHQPRNSFFSIAIVYDVIKIGTWIDVAGILGYRAKGRIYRRLTSVCGSHRNDMFSNSPLLRGLFFCYDSVDRKLWVLICSVVICFELEIIHSFRYRTKGRAATLLSYLSSFHLSIRLFELVHIKIE